MSKGIKRDLRKAMQNVNKEIAGMSVGKYGSGLAVEGYAGGYRDALSDVQLALNNVYPNNSRFWPRPKP